jgi:hypothetical protein
LLYSCSPDCTDLRHQHAAPPRSAHPNVAQYDPTAIEEDPLGLLAQVKRLPKAERDLIVGGNAARLLKLK